MMVATRRRIYESQDRLPARVSIVAKPRTKISVHRPHTIPTPSGFPFKLNDATYGLIQERIHTNLYALVVQAILWNQTHGLAARPVLFQLLTLYPDPVDLSQANIKSLTAILQPIGLQNIRAARLIALAKVWVAAPPCTERRYRKLHYPVHKSGIDVGPREIISEDDKREGWEIAHLPGVGRYALDSFRIFHRDQLRSREVDGSIEPEWMRVLPEDKDLRAYLSWRWEQEGWDWNMLTGKRTKIST